MWLYKPLGYNVGLQPTNIVLGPLFNTLLHTGQMRRLKIEMKSMKTEHLHGL